MRLGTPVTIPNGQQGVVIGRDGIFHYYDDGGNPNIAVYAVRLEDGEVRFFVGDALATLPPDQEIRRSGALK